MANPIVQRELMTTLRAPRSAWALAVTVGVLLLLTLALWPAGGLYSLGEQASHMLLSAVALGGLLLVLLIAPAFTATSLTSEKENASYDLLTHTLLRPGQIAWGKIVSSQVFLLLLVISILPVLAATLFLGGAAAEQLLMVVAVIAGAAAATGLLGFAVSAWCHESFTALVVTYSGMLIWCSLPLFCPILLPGLVTQVPFLGMLAYCSPLSAMLNVLDPGFFAGMKLPVDAEMAWGFGKGGKVLMLGLKKSTLIYFSSCLALGGGSWIAGMVSILRPSLTAKNKAGGLSAEEKKVGFPFVLMDPRRRRRLIGNWSNPILAKELRSKTFGQGPWIVRGMYATFALSLLLVGLMVKQGMGQRMDFDILKLAMLAFQLLVVILLVPALLAGAVTQEEEQMQFQLLRQTLIRPHTFLTGKMLSVWMLVVLLLVASIPMWWMMAYLESYQWIGTLVSLAVVCSTLILTSSISMAASSAARTTAAATAISFAVVCLFAFGTLVPLLMGGQLPASWRTAILAWNPFASGLQAVSLDFLKGEPLLWWRFVTRALLGSVIFFAAAWFFLWRRLRRHLA
ncbi:MAG: ABC transporter permease [Verrucomicrobiae bacterium]|nr:ABC transporter permease [Verrucomicrobiae bacterium]